MKKVKTKRKSLIVRLGIFAFAAFVATSLISLQLEISAKRAELGQVQEQIDDQQTAIKETERLISLGTYQSYLSKIARDKLGLGFSDEHVYRDAAGS